MTHFYVCINFSRLTLSVKINTPNIDLVACLSFFIEIHLFNKIKPFFIIIFKLDVIVTCVMKICYISIQFFHSILAACAYRISNKFSRALAVQRVSRVHTVVWLTTYERTELPEWLVRRGSFLILDVCTRSLYAHREIFLESC